MLISRSYPSRTQHDCLVPRPPALEFGTSQSLGPALTLSYHLASSSPWNESRAEHQRSAGPARVIMIVVADSSSFVMLVAATIRAGRRQRQSYRPAGCR